MASTIKPGDKIRVYGYGAISNSDYHNGCRAVVESETVLTGCTGRMQEPALGVKFSDGSFDWIHPIQAVKIKRIKK